MIEIKKSIRSSSGHFEYMLKRNSTNKVRYGTVRYGTVRHSTVQYSAVSSQKFCTHRLCYEVLDIQKLIALKNNKKRRMRIRTKILQFAFADSRLIND
jgi:hypothetical protein